MKQFFLMVLWFEAQKNLLYTYNQTQKCQINDFIQFLNDLNEYWTIFFNVISFMYFLVIWKTYCCWGQIFDNLCLYHLFKEMSLAYCCDTCLLLKTLLTSWCPLIICDIDGYLIYIFHLSIQFQSTTSSHCAAALATSDLSKSLSFSSCSICSSFSFNAFYKLEKKTNK